MTPAAGTHLAELYRRWGRRVVEAGGVYWASIDPGSRIFTPVLDHGDYAFSQAEVRELLREAGGLVARYPTTTQGGLEGGAYVCEDASYDLSHVSKRMRNQIRRGSEQCEIRTLTADELERLCLPLNRDTDERHGRQRPEFCDAHRWARTAHATFDAPGTVALGAFVSGQLASYEIVVRDGAWIYALIQMSRTELLGHHPNQTLDYYINRWGFEQPGVEGICIGPVPLRPRAGLHDYKMRLGFQVAPRRTALCLHGAIAWAGQSAAAEKLVRWARRVPPLHGRLEGLEIAIAGSRRTAGAVAESFTPFGPVAERTRESL